MPTAAKEEYIVVELTLDYTINSEGSWREEEEDTIDVQEERTEEEEDTTGVPHIEDWPEITDVKGLSIVEGDIGLVAASIQDCIENTQG